MGELNWGVPALGRHLWHCAVVGPCCHATWQGGTTRTQDIKGEEPGSAGGEGGPCGLLQGLLDGFPMWPVCGELAFQLQRFAFPRKTWAAPHQSKVFPAGLCPHTLGWMMVPTAASSTPGTAAGTSDRALLCVAPGPTV